MFDKNPVDKMVNGVYTVLYMNKCSYVNIKDGGL